MSGENKEQEVIPDSLVKGIKDSDEGRTVVVDFDSHEWASTEEQNEETEQRVQQGLAQGESGEIVEFDPTKDLEELNKKMSD